MNITKFIFIGLIVMTCQSSNAESRFLSNCNLNNFIKPNLENKFKLSGCDQLMKKLGTLTSFSEIYYPDRKKESKRKLLSAPWTDDFPYLYGLNKRVVENQYFNSPSFSTIGLGEQTLRTEIFLEFKNLTDIAYLPEYPYYQGQNGICKILEKFPQINTVTIDWKILLNPKVDACLSKIKNGVIIRNEFKAFGALKPETKIIGIEYFTGKFINIENFKHLRYIGVSNTSNTLNGIEYIYKLSKLSHFSMNIKKSLEDAEKLTFLRDLEYLNITCIKTEAFNTLSSDRCEEGDSLRNINFLSDMIWLKHLNLSFNSIVDISPLLHLTDLTSLKLRGNQIRSVPDLSSLNKLKYLDLSGNELTDIENLSTATSLYFLNLSGNSIKNIDPLSRLNALKFLNVSNNLKLKTPSATTRFPSLKILNLNGRTGESKSATSLSDINQYSLSGYEDERDLLFETLFHDFNSNSLNEHPCTSFSTIADDFVLSGFTALDILFAKRNGLSSVPKLADNSNIRYFNLEANNIVAIPAQLKLDNLQNLDLGKNDFESIPDISFLKNLKEASFNQNLISEISNLIKISRPKLMIDVMNNLIKNIYVLTKIPQQDFNQSFQIRLGNNMIEENQNACPTEPNYILKEDCIHFLKGSHLGLIGRQRPKIAYEDYDPFITEVKALRCK